MNAEELIAQARETLGTRREYGEPYERNGVTVIPVSSVRGGGGGGTDREGDGGGGFGMMARPTGAWVIRGDDVTWQPAIDPARIMLGLELVAAAALLRRPPRRPRMRMVARRRMRMVARRRMVARVRGLRLPRH
jgi:hypothetical protein